MDIVMAPSVTAANGDTEGGAPVTVIEASAAGKPVIGSHHCDIPSIVSDGESGYLCPERDVQCLVEKMAVLVADSAKRSQMGAAGKEYVKKNHTIAVQVQKITAVYREALECCG
jgi:colanic acid/amylovoran biosynthesis glycosyltransferase